VDVMEEFNGYVDTIDEKGNRTRMFPKTKVENIEDYDELTEQIVTDTFNQVKTELNIK